MNASQSGNVLYALKLAIALSKMVQEPGVTKQFMYIWDHTQEKINLPFSWIWVQFRKIEQYELSATIYLESDEILGNTITAAEIVKIVHDIDRVILERTHEMVAKAKIDIDVSSLQMNEAI